MKYLSSIIVTLLFVLSLNAQESTELSQYNETPSRLRGVIERYVQDKGSLERFLTAPTSLKRFEALKSFNSKWILILSKQDFESLNHDGQIDYVLFKNFLNHEQLELDRGRKQFDEMAALIPFSETISSLDDKRRMFEEVDSAKAATMLNDLSKRVVATQVLMVTNTTTKRTVANRAAKTIGSLRNTLRNWFNYYNGYDPMFSWWTSEPYKAVEQSLQNYQVFITEKMVGIKADDKTTIIGDPIGREALIRELDYEMIPYSPEELIELANREFAWCETEMKKASREMGFGDDWKKALESVKNKYVEPGKQPAMIEKLAKEAIDFVKMNNLVTVPKLAEETWRMEMMSPERQLVSPFFLGGETILVSYPTNTMAHEQKMMSLRGNNPHFSHATVHHELIPGHHLQGFMLDRYRTYRSLFYTPFWMEGWALYWEFLLWDKGFHKTPEDKVGALFWRMHRCARIIFSLSFHLEKISPNQAVDFLVDRVGHERDNATAEVRRSFAGDYGPLYQIAYMLGGLQFYNLHRDLVDSKKMTDRQFHDAILKEGAIPVELVRAILTKQKLKSDFKTSWNFYGALSN
jgi:Bacterial protein of unknown function (DUF885)